MGLRAGLFDMRASDVRDNDAVIASRGDRQRPLAALSFTRTAFSPEDSRHAPATATAFP